MGFIASRLAPRGRAIAVRVLLSAALVAAAGCYKPNVHDGGFQCATTGTPCPEGFSCAVDHHCWRDPTMVKVDGGQTMCTTDPVTPVCNDRPAAGQACNPACQTGCDCGRCNLVAGVPTCVAPGTGKVGEVCKFGKDDNCAPGLICLQEACGNGLGRCYRHCATNDQCAGSICQFQIEGTSFKVCDVPPQACDPVADVGCPNPALHCYITSGDTTLCDCANNMPGKGMTGDACNLYSDCAPGFVCAKDFGEGAYTCHLACKKSAPSCLPNGATCAGGTTFGHCGIGI